MKLIKIILVAVLVATTGCDKEPNTPTRSFYMGFTPFPYAISLEAVEYTYEQIETISDIIAHHFDNGVPWLEALANADFSENIMNDWSFRKSRTSAGKKVYVAVAALSNERDGLAKYRGDQDEMPLPDPWNTYDFGDVEVQQAYVNYCKRIIDYFEPDFFNMNVEANLLYFLSPDKWNGFLQFHQFVYNELKTSYPDLVLFSSVTGAQMLDGFITGNDHVQQRLAAMQILDHSDLYGLSFYPYLSDYRGNPYPENVFEELFNISPKPLAVTETGYVAQSFTINTQGTDVMIESDEVKQNKYTDDLLKACQTRRALFVIQFLFKDYDELWAQAGSRTDLIIAWRDSGLVDENGHERPALSTWKSFFARELNQN
jgi:hypothetical protein